LSSEENSGDYEAVEEDILVGKISAKSELLQRIKRSITQQDGVVQRKKVRFGFLLSCGHFIHDVSEIGGQCQYNNCDALVCKDCLRICERCLKPICPKHTKVHDGKPYCPRCKWFVLFFGSGGGRSERKRVDRGKPWYSKSISEYLFK
jgi:hypothetical protein